MPTADDRVPRVGHHPASRPSLRRALAFRCPYCGLTPMRKSWFHFADGCAACDFMYEREEGYYTGASWLVTFPAVGVAGFGMAGLLLGFVPSLDWMLVVILTSVAMIAFALWFTPYSFALWLWFEHRLHPLNADDHFAPVPPQT